MKPLSRKIEGIPHSAIRKIFDLCIGMEDVVSFALGEPDFPTPERIVEAAVTALRQGCTRYTSNRGIIELREAIARMLKEKKNVARDPETEIIVTAGGMQALYMAMSVLLNPGDEVIVGAPCFTNYYGEIIANDGVPVYVPLKEEDGFVLKREALEQAVTEKTKAILLNTPSNPLGNAMKQSELQELVDFIIAQDLYVISDEVYQDYVYEDGEQFYSIAAFPGMKDRTIIVDSFSKAYAMTGWRVGSAAARADIISQMVKMVEASTSCVNAPGQYGALEALNGPQDDLVEMIQTFKRRRDLLFAELSQIDKLSCLKPKGAFYFFINITKTGLSAEEFALRLLTEAKVAVIPGTGFGDQYGEGYVRLSYVKSDADIKEGIRRIKAFVASL